MSSNQICKKRVSVDPSFLKFIWWIIQDLYCFARRLPGPSDVLSCHAISGLPIDQMSGEIAEKKCNELTAHFWNCKNFSCVPFRHVKDECAKGQKSVASSSPSNSLFKSHQEALLLFWELHFNYHFLHLYHQLLQHPVSFLHILMIKWWPTI